MTQHSTRIHKGFLLINLKVEKSSRRGLQRKTVGGGGVEGEEGK